MPSLLKRLAALATLLAACGCPKSGSGPTAGPDEEAAKSAFASFQEAMKARDGEKIFALLDSESQADAERAARSVRDAYAKATPAEKAETEKAMGLSAAELAGLDAKGFLKSKRFHGKYDEIADGKFEKATVQGDLATVAYLEEDGDKEKLPLARQGGGWKVSLPMPK
jgi:hypothetical protein